MIQVEKHGNQYSWYRCTCPECGCIFVFTQDDIDVNIVYNEYTAKMIYCPECGEKIRRWKVNPQPVRNDKNDK